MLLNFVTKDFSRYFNSITTDIRRWLNTSLKIARATHTELQL